MTAFGLALKALNEQRPIDHRWLRNLYYSMTPKQRREWAKNCLECVTLGNESKQMIGRAATEFLSLVRNEI